MRRRRDRPREALHVDVPEVLEGQAVRHQPSAELADGDAGLHSHQPGGTVDVDHARQAVEGEHQAVAAGDVAEGMPRAEGARLHAPPRRTGDRGGQLVD